MDRVQYLGESYEEAYQAVVGRDRPHDPTLDSF